MICYNVSVKLKGVFAMTVKVESMIEVEDFHRYLSRKGITPNDGEVKWYTFVLTEVTLDMIVYGVLARWVSTYCNDSIESIINDLKELAFDGVRFVKDTDK
jgi:hypothetical protein